MGSTIQVTAPVVSSCKLRPARANDLDGIASVWREGWIDGHRGHVPPVLEPHRTVSELRRLARGRVTQTTVAVSGNHVMGFLVVEGDEIEQLYVAGPCRGSGLASILIRSAEASIAQRYEAAWLAVATGNTRARRFYESVGWHDTAAIDYPAEVAGGVIVVRCRRYERRLRTDVDGGAT